MSYRRDSEGDAGLEPTYTGFIRSTLDALVIFEACRRGVCPKISRRLHDRERHLIASGSVFVFSETEAGIKRWTDGLIWSPSRIIGNFLVYRELVKRPSAGDDDGSLDTISPKRHPVPLPSVAELEAANLQRAQERALVGSLTGSAKFKEGGLVKKTISLAGMHMITYYALDDVYQGRLREPSTLPELASFEISPDLLISKSFRQPLHIEAGPDGVPRYRGEGDEPELAPALAPLYLPTPSPSISSGSNSAPSSAGGYLSPVGDYSFGFLGPHTASTSASAHSRPVSPADAFASSNSVARPHLTRHSSGGALSSSQRTQPRYETGSRPSTTQRFEPYSQGGRRSFDEQQQQPICPLLVCAVGPG
jgi:hypothetical protein